MSSYCSSQTTFTVEFNARSVAASGCKSTWTATGGLSSSTWPSEDLCLLPSFSRWIRFQRLRVCDRLSVCVQINAGLTCPHAGSFCRFTDVKWRGSTLLSSLLLKHCLVLLVSELQDGAEFSKMLQFYEISVELTWIWGCIGHFIWYTCSTAR